MLLSEALEIVPPVKLVAPSLLLLLFLLVLSSVAEF